MALATRRNISPVFLSNYLCCPSSNSAFPAPEGSIGQTGVRRRFFRSFNFSFVSISAFASSSSTGFCVFNTSMTMASISASVGIRPRCAGGNGVHQFLHAGQGGQRLRLGFFQTLDDLGRQLFYEPAVGMPMAAALSKTMRAIWLRLMGAHSSYRVHVHCRALRVSLAWTGNSSCRKRGSWSMGGVGNVLRGCPLLP